MDTTSEKMKYIWDYYKFFIIGSIALVFLVSYSINSVLSKKVNVLNIVMLTGMVEPDDIETLRQTLLLELLTEEEQEKSDILIQNMKTSSDNTIDVQAGMNIQKMVAELSSGGIDIFIVEREFFNQMNAENQLLSIQQLSGLTSLPYPEDQLFYSEENGEEVTGIHVSAIGLLDKVLMYDKDKILCVPANAKNIEFVSKFLQFILQS